MNVDTSGAGEVARLAMGHAWEWTQEGVMRFFRDAGWRVDAEEVSPDHLITSLDVNRAKARVSVYDGSPEALLIPGVSVEYVTSFVTDRINELASESSDSIIDAFVELSESLVTVLGRPVNYEPGRMPEIGWRLPTVVITLRALSRSVVLKFENPVYRRWLDSLVEDEVDESFEDDEDRSESQVFDSNSNWHELISRLIDALIGLQRYDALDVSGEDVEYLQVVYRQRQEGTPEAGLVLQCNIMADPFENGIYLDRQGARTMMADAGWLRVEDGPGNFWRIQFDWPFSAVGAQAIAEDIVSVLQEYFGLENPSGIELDVF